MTENDYRAEQTRDGYHASAVAVIIRKRPGDDTSDPVRDFTSEIEALAQSDAIGGTHVEHSGVAFSVVDDE